MTEVAAGGRLRQRPAVQRDLPATVPAAAHGAAAKGVAEASDRHDRRRHGEAWLSAALRLGRDPGVPSRRGPSLASRWYRTIAMHVRIAIGGERGVLAVEPADAELPQGDRSLSRSRQPAGDHRARPPRLRPCRRSGGDRRASQPGPADWRRWSPRGRVSGCPARGMASNSPCARFSGSRSPCRRRRRLAGKLVSRLWRADRRSRLPSTWG